MEAWTLLRRPGHYFRAMQRHPAAFGWAPAVVVYFLSASSRIFPAARGGLPETSLLGVLGVSVLAGVVLLWLPALLTGGLWLHLGSKLVGGTGTLAQSMKTAGYAQFWPTLLGLPALALASLAPIELDREHLEGADLVPLLGGAALRIVAALWSAYLLIRAAAAVHDLGLGRALLLVLWTPLVYLALYGVFGVALLWLLT